MTDELLDDQAHDDASELSQVGNYWLKRTTPWLRFIAFMLMVLGLFWGTLSVFVLKITRSQNFTFYASFMLVFVMSVLSIVLAILLIKRTIGIKKYMKGEDSRHLDLALKNGFLFWSVISVFMICGIILFILMAQLD